MSASALVIGFLLLLTGGSAFLAWLFFQKQAQATEAAEALNRTLDGYKKRFAPVIDIDRELHRVKQGLDERRASLNETSNAILQAEAELANLSAKTAILRDAVELGEVGMYEPHFDFDMSDEYKEHIKDTREEQKDMVKAGTAVVAGVAWTVGGSEKEGQKMQKKAIQLTTRAFNNECQSCVDEVSWSNIDRMIERMKKARDDINKFNEINKIVISEEYLNLKIDEIRLVHEWKAKKQQEKEEQAEIKRQMREEEKAEKEALAAAARAQQEESRFGALLEKAKQQEREIAARALADQSQAGREALAKIQEEKRALEAQLAEAHARNVRAMSMAQQTKTGHVYVISNVGSFGENVFKIGMTRRLDPQDRVDELGDASVPFCFDVHAMIHSSNAPEMEARLHRAFEKHRVNRVNLKKEFFRVSLADIQREVAKVSPDAVFTTTALADEFQQSQAIRLGEHRN